MSNVRLRWLLAMAGIIAPLTIAANEGFAAGIASAPDELPPASTAAPQDAGVYSIAASPPTDVSVTIYRGFAGADSLDLDRLGGFALVSETRTISIPAGESRIRFEGVAGGILSQSALVTGLPDGLLEKNRDARLLSPSALVAATVGHSVRLLRTNPKTGKTTSVSGTLLSDTDGVVFQSGEGIEALRCSGLPETFSFDPATDTTATPTLSAVVRTPNPVTVQVKLSYLAEGFDWMANYNATVAPDGKTMDLGAWVTLANSNGESFPEAHAQVVAGRVNRESGDIDPVDAASEILADCWPRGSTSDTPEQPHVVRATPLIDTLGGGVYGTLVVVTAQRRANVYSEAPSAMMAIQEVVVTQQEQLGDLKLYRVPLRTSVTSRQVKQVRMLDAHAIPIELLYGAPVHANTDTATGPLRKLARTHNNKAHHLGIPLPSGVVDSFYLRDGAPLLVSQAPLRDLAVDEDVEFDLGEAPDVQMTAVIERTQVDPGTLKKLPLIPGMAKLRSVTVNDINRIEVHNAHDFPISVELWLQLDETEQLVRADHAPITRYGRPAFELAVPANGSAVVRYQTADTSTTVEPE
jgi:hypothetical protein